MITTDHIQGFFAGVAYILVIVALTWIRNLDLGDEDDGDRGYTDHWHMEG